MKILLTHRFFFPDTALYAIMLRSIGALTNCGHDVHVIGSLPSYRDGPEARAARRWGDLIYGACGFSETRRPARPR